MSPMQVVDVGKHWLFYRYAMIRRAYVPKTFRPTLHLLPVTVNWLMRDLLGPLAIAKQQVSRVETAEYAIRWKSYRTHDVSKSAHAVHAYGFCETESGKAWHFEKDSYTLGMSVAPRVDWLAVITPKYVTGLTPFPVMGVRNGILVAVLQPIFMEDGT